MTKKYCDRCQKEISDGAYFSIITVEDIKYTPNDKLYADNNMKVIELCKYCRNRLSKFMAMEAEHGNKS